jgi:hypothetical protein
VAQSKPQYRTIEVTLPAPYEGWTATMKAEGVSARVLIELQSGDAARSLKAVESLIVKHNYLNTDGEAAASVLDCPMDALSATIEQWSAGVAALPPR